MTSKCYFHVLTESTRILAVDDDPIMREFATVYLTSPNTSVETAPDGEAGLKAIGERRFDLVLLDIDMPGLSGFDVLERLRSDTKMRDLSVVVVTGREDIVSIDRAYQLGATSFVCKPVNWRLIAYQIRYVLRAAAGSAPEAVGPDARAA